MEFRKWVLPELHWHPNSWNLQWHSFCQGQVRLDSLTIKSGSRMTTASTLAFTLNFPMYPVPPPMMRILLIPAIEKYYIVKTYWKFLLFTSEEMLQWAFTWLRSQQDREREERAVRFMEPGGHVSSWKFRFLFIFIFLGMTLHVHDVILTSRWRHCHFSNFWNRWDGITTLFD